MFAKSDAQDRGSGSIRREWLLPVALFFVSVGAIARVILELRLAPHQQVLGLWLGPFPVLVLLTGMAGLGVVWYLRGTIAFPFRKVLALLVLCLPLACFLGTLQGVPADEGLPWGGVAGRNIARTLPAMVGVGGTGLLILFSLLLAWKLAFTASKSLFTDPLSPALRPAFAGLPAASPSAVMRSPSLGSGPVEARPVPAAVADEEADDAFPAGDPAAVEEEGSLFAPPPGPETVEPEDERGGTAAAQDDTGAELPAHLAVPQVLDGLHLEPPGLQDSRRAMGATEAVLILREDEDIDPGESNDDVESRLRALEEVESRRLATPAPVQTPDGESALDARPLGAGGVPGDGIDLRESMDTAATDSGDDATPPLFAIPPAVLDDSIAAAPEAQAEEPEGGLPAGRRLVFRTGERVALTDEEVEAELESEDEDEIFGAGVPEESIESGAEGPGIDAEAEGEDDDDTFPLFAGEEKEESGIPSAAARTAGDSDDDEPLPGLSWRGLRTPKAEDEPTVVMARVRTEEAPSPSFHLQAEMEAAAQAGRHPAVDRSGTAGEDWAAWDDADQPRPGTRAPRPRRAVRPGESAASAQGGGGVNPEDQQILFAHRSDVDDDLYRRAVDLIIAEDRCSAAMLQRMLPATFSEATAILDRMHDEGVVGPQLPSGRRELLRR